jgi:uncharacterized protein YkwD
MSKAGRFIRIMLLVAILFFGIGATHQTNAQTLDGFTSVYSHACFSGKNVNSMCLASNKNCIVPLKAEPKQIQSAVVLASSTTPTPNTQAINLPAAPTLTSEYASDSAALDSDKIFNLVNQYRSSKGLAPFEKEDSVCSLATTRSAEIPAELSSGILHSGLYNRALPYWIWENAKIGTNEEGTVAWWLQSPIHHQSIVGDYKYSCVKCTGSACSQLFTSFVPK